MWLPFTWRVATNPGGPRNGHAGGCASRASFVDVLAWFRVSGRSVESETELTLPLVQPLGSTPITARVTATTKALAHAFMPRSFVDRCFI